MAPNSFDVSDAGNTYKLSNIRFRSFFLKLTIPDVILRIIRNVRSRFIALVKLFNSATYDFNISKYYVRNRRSRETSGSSIIVEAILSVIGLR